MSQRECQHNMPTLPRTLTTYGYETSYDTARHGDVYDDITQQL